MKRIRQVVIGTWVGGWALLALCGNALAQYSLDGSVPGASSARAEWQQRVLKTGRVQPAVVPQTELTDYRFSPGVVYQRPPVQGRVAGYSSAGYRQAMPDGVPAEPGRPEPIPPGTVQQPGQVRSRATVHMDPVPVDEGRVFTGDPTLAPGAGGCGAGGCRVGGEFAGCGDNGACGGGCYDECDTCCACGFRSCGWLFRDFSVFAGVQAFKGPPDRGMNGNFGFHEGFNFGAPIGLWNFGYQVGFNATQSNFSGDQVVGQVHGATRHQYFVTGGVFHRALCGGLQSGVAFDYLHDNYYYAYLNDDQRADLKQLRSETSLVLPNGSEIGYYGAYALGGHRVVDFRLDPNDMFVFFLRRRFELGGDGRIWGGASGRGEGLIGADLRVPLGRAWAIENRITYLIPKQGHGAEAQTSESWGMTIQLVWYPGRASACEGLSQFRPLFNVADNSTFLVRASAP